MIKSDLKLKEASPSVLFPEMDTLYELSANDIIEDTAGPCKIYIVQTARNSFYYFHSSGEGDFASDRIATQKNDFDNLKIKSRDKLVAVITGHSIFGTISEIYDKAPKYTSFGGNRV